ncbi:MAG TPA: hypothetical protein VFQ45_18540, partial [Longimicrobium sp.]|nr:hypothetical protein [Longimicrobium sp.]
VVGLAPRDIPLAPLAVGVDGSAVEVSVTPAARPEAVSWAAADAGVVPASGAVQLRLTSRTPGTVTLRDIIVTAAGTP